jgi:hypothetical protein
MAYEVKYKDKTGCGATYVVATREEAAKRVLRLLEHGTKYAGDKVTDVHVKWVLAAGRKLEPVQEAL